MKAHRIKQLQRAAQAGEPIDRELAVAVLSSSAEDMPQLLAAASTAKSRHFGNIVKLCSILNARSGACSEDCAFCAQASCHDTGVQPVPLYSKEELVQAYEEASRLPITHFSIVTSGCALSSRGVDQICEAIQEEKISGLNWCASLGCLEQEQLSALKQAGLRRFHHNLETAPSFFPQICMTHSYQQRLDTIRSVREAGLEVCCGGIIGLGESMEQRVEFAETLAREAVDSIPLNFLIPIPGTRLESMEPMQPMDILRTVIMFRLTNPRAEIRVCAGRKHLRDLQSMIFYAGANGMMIGPLLTVAGREVEHDLQMLVDLGVEHAR